MTWEYSADNLTEQTAIDLFFNHLYWKLNSVNGLQRQADRTPAANRRLAQWRVTWLIEHSTSHQLLWCIDSFVLRNPPLRQAPKRYSQC